MKKMITAAIFTISAVGVMPLALASTHSQALRLVEQAKQLAATHASATTNMYTIQPAQQIAQQALSYGKTHQVNGLGAVSPTDCIKEVQTLITDSTGYATKLEKGQYKGVGNLVMRIMTSAATTTYTVLTSFNVCGLNAMAGYDTAAVLDTALKLADKDCS